MFLWLAAWAPAAFAGVDACALTKALDHWTPTLEASLEKQPKDSAVLKQSHCVTLPLVQDERPVKAFRVFGAPGFRWQLYVLSDLDGGKTSVSIHLLGGWDLAFAELPSLRTVDVTNTGVSVAVALQDY
ncbi:MAG: hypothetical protein HY925_09545, partial [Elusimicrobia bacterium]|nr:hypothetical protein [Elusimicrobiota bacterium]